ncbi:MAG: amidohydrolase family protein, partial [Novosphingobium sp.]
VEKSLADMDKAGVETAMLSLNSPGLFAGTPEGNRALARHVNEYAARAQADHPGRFGHFASLPLADTEGALREIVYALDVLKADGFVVRTSDEDRWHGDPSYWPVYEELNRRKAVLFVHPASALCCQKMNYAFPPAIIEYPFDTTRAITNWIFSGAAARFPDIRLIYTHGGGSTLMVQDRLEAFAKVRPDLGERLPQGKDVMEVIRSHFYDTALVYNKPAFAAMREGLPLSQILFGSDVPYRQLGSEVAALPLLVRDAAEFRAIERNNAEALFPRLGQLGMTFEN